MQLTVKVKLIPTKEQKMYIQDTTLEYIKTVNDTVSLMIAENNSLKLTSKDVVANLPSAVKNQTIRDSKSIFSKYKKTKIKSINNKEQRHMKDQGHKISRGIVNFAIQNNISIIRLEQLTNIRNTAKTSRKNEKNLHTWSFYRLAQYIEYKALLEGIKVEYVNPHNTSKQCPICGKLNTAKDRKYQCSCGYKTHRDLNACINIINATVVDGNSLQA